MASWRFLVLGLVAALVLGTGCEKRSGEGEKGSATKALSPEALKPPAGMALVRFKLPGSPKESVFFIDEKPVTNEQFEALYSKTLAGSPVGWTDDKAPQGKEKDAVLVADPEIARDYAAWMGKRVPTADEWKAAVQIVGSGEYPYGQTIGRAFPIYCALDVGTTPEVSEKQRQPIVEKYVMLEQRKLQEIQPRIARLEKGLETSAEELRKAEAPKKVAAYVEAVGRTAEAEALSRGYALLAQRAEDVFKQKAATVVHAKAAKAAPEQTAAAEKQYVDWLRKQLNQYEEEGKKIDDQIASKQADLDKLRKALDAALDLDVASVGGPSLPATLPESMTELVALESRMDGREKALQAKAADLEAIRKLLPDIEKGTPSLADQEKAFATKTDGAKAEIEKARKKISDASQYVEKQFMEENLVLRSAEQVVVQTARLVGLTQRIDWLKKHTP